MAKYLSFLPILFSLYSCGSSTSLSSDNGDKFIGQWQSPESEKKVYSITKINDHNYHVEWNGYVSGGSGGAFPIPGQLHSGGELNANYANGNLEVMNTPVVSMISENEIMINDERCTRK